MYHLSVEGVRKENLFCPKRYAPFALHFISREFNNTLGKTFLRRNVNDSVIDTNIFPRRGNDIPVVLLKMH